MPISHRLKSPMGIRPDCDINEQPKRIIFLSVEGNNTEKDYFNYVYKFRVQLGIKSVVHIETLSREDTFSDPESVLNLLEDCKGLQIEGIKTDDLLIELEKEGVQLSVDILAKYINKELSDEETQSISDQILLAGIDYNYQDFLSNFKGSDDSDIFAIVIDRDSHCHQESTLRRVLYECNKKNYQFYISNPCFEFWLLLHLSDVKEEYKDCLSEILSNRHVSNNHTYVSKLISIKANHYKSISEDIFKEMYLNNIDTAISRAKDFSVLPEDLFVSLGSNVFKLFDILRE